MSGWLLQDFKLVMLYSILFVVILSYQALGQILIKMEENNNNLIALLLKKLQWLSVVYRMNLNVSVLYNQAPIYFHNVISCHPLPCKLYLVTVSFLLQKNVTLCLHTALGTS